MQIRSKRFAALFLFVFIAACGRTEPTGESGRADVASPLDQGFQLQDAAPVDIDGFFALFPERRRPTYARSRFDDRLGATIVEDIVIPGEHDGRSIQIERGEFYGLDVDAIARVSAAEANDDREALFEKIRLLNVRSDGYADDTASADLSIGGAEIDRLEMRAVSDDANGAGIAMALKLAGLYFKDFALTSQTSETPTVMFSASDLRFVDYEAGRIGAVIGKEFTYDIRHSAESLAAIRDMMGPQAGLFFGPLKGFIAPDRQVTSVGEMDWRGINIAGLLGYAAREEEPPLTARDLIDLGDMRARAMETRIDGKRAAYIEEASMSAGEFTWLLPSNIRADTRGAVYDFTAYVGDDQAETLAVLKKHGLDEVRGSGVAEWRWDEKSGAIAVNYEALADKFADFRLNLALGGFVYDEMVAASQSGEKNAVAALGAFEGMSLSLTDRHALAAAFDVAALQMGGSGEDLRLSIPAMIRVTSLQAAGGNRRLMDYADAIAEFVAKGGALEIKAAPAQPVSFVSLQNGSINPQDLPDALNLTVTRKE